MKWRFHLCTLLLALLASEAEAAITGTVFRDYNSNGIREAAEPGIGGVVVNAYGVAGAAVGNSPQVTAANGTYSLSGLPAGPLRIELTLSPALGYLKSGIAGSTTAFFAQDGAVLLTAFQLPADFCQAEPPLFTTSFVTLDNVHPLDEYDHTFGIASVAVPYSENSTAPNLSWVTASGELGSAHGVAWQSATGRLFASSYVKSIAGLGPDGTGGTTTGGIYELTQLDESSSTASLFLNLEGLAGTGTDPHPAPTDVCPSVLVGDVSNLSCWFHDSGTFARVGKLGLGDLDFNSDETRLYTVNLNNRTLVMLPVGVPAAAPPAAAIEVFPTPSADCANPADARPFALARHDDPNRMYLGVTCTAQSSQLASELAVWIYEFNRGTGPGTETYTPVFNHTLAYTRARPTGFFGGACDAVACPATWRPWQDDFNLLNKRNEDKRTVVVAHPQPLLTDFAFDGPNLVLAIRDRSADQGGIRTGNPTDTSDARRYNWYQAGDLVRACDTDGNPATPGWTMESNGTCGGITGAGANDRDGFGPFPQNGEYYFDQLFLGNGTGHSELFTGGLAQIPGRGTLAATMMDANAFNEGAISTWSHATGTRATAARIYLNIFDAEFGEANGLGDLEALCAPAPLELGNRLWCDGDRDGVQDPGESGVNGISVRLQCGAGNPVTVTTAGDGNYLFTDALYAAANGGLPLPRRATCTILVDTTGANGAALRAACGGAMPSPPDNGGADAGADLRDSDGLLAGSTVMIAFTTGGPGANDHSLDQGFIQVAAPVFTDFGDAPAPYPTLLADNGARHVLLATGNPTLGAFTDSEVDGQPSATNSGDDLNGIPDDEDGVVFAGVLTGGSNTTVTVTTGATGGRLDAWIDWNRDGDWSDPGEQIATGQLLAANSSTGLAVAVPADVVAGGTSARFRLSLAGGLAPTGSAADGEVEDHGVTLAAAPPVTVFDFGDAPAPYPTLLAANGARHVLLASGNPTLGAFTDSEADGQPSATNSGDDLNGVPDDEDGVVFAGVLTGGTNTTVTVTTGATGGRLDAWIDWNRDGDWSDPGEQIATGQLLAANSSTGLAVAVPADVVAGSTSARFRLSLAGGLAPTGLASDGEVEDHGVTLAAAPPVTVFDFGDAPAPYPALLAANGARHALLASGNPTLGAFTDSEADGQPSATNSGDDLNGVPDDEDGVTFAGVLTGGTNTTVTVTTGSTGGRLDAWIDWNRDGDWSDPGEQIATSQLLAANSSTGLSVAVPADVVAGGTSARFRLSLAGGLAPTGSAADGEVEDHGVTLAAAPPVTVFDFGDAPAPYPTLLAANGARHILLASGNPTLGAITDSEADGQPSATNSGDDLNGIPDDEDGVVFAGVLTGGSNTTVTVTTGATGGRLDAWIDWNRDGDWSDPGEQIATGQLLAANSSTGLSVAVPADVVAGGTSARFRLSSAGGLAPTGSAADGEVEDHGVTLAAAPPVTVFDFGDAPAPYPTLLAANGARHALLASGNPTLGAITDSEADGQPSAANSGDDLNGVPDDEDGVAFAGVLTGGTNTTVTVTTGATGGRLDAWIDWNRDGDWSDPGEQIATNQLLAANSSTGLSVAVPADVVAGGTSARFRLSSAGVLAPTGLASDGEVEDHGVTLAAAPPVTVFDFGDAPAPYPTLLAANGARHVLLATGNPMLGAFTDSEADGQPSATNSGDDLNGVPDDEDGVAFAGVLTGGTNTTVTVTTGATGGRLDAWIDWNRDGDWSDPGEQIVTGQLLAANSSTGLAVAVPANVVAGGTSARFRLSSAGGLSPTGLAADGEVEDHGVTLAAAPPVTVFDFGDAPAPYPTLLAANGARHVLLASGNPTLGAFTDSEADGQPSATNSGDDLNGVPDDEDGVAFAGVLTGGTNTTVTVTTGATGGRLDAWIDWNRDGDWSDPGEQIATSQLLAANSSTGLAVAVPANVVAGGTSARFRLSSSGGLTPAGPAPDGEVEDYAVALGVEDPEIGLALQALSVLSMPGGEFRVIYELRIANSGDVPLSSLRATLNLAATFAGATTWSVVGLTSDDFAINGAFNGGSDVDLLAGTDSLAVGGVGLLQLVVRVVPGANSGPYLASAVGRGLSPIGASVEDTSQDGVNPDPDNDGDPTNNNDPTPVVLLQGASPVPANIPTLGEWGLMLLSLLLCGLALRRLRRQGLPVR